MASEAYGNVKRTMDAERERELAAYIMRDVELRQQNAKERGVLAYGKKPIPRSVVNQRFLQNTLKSVDFGNRVARENEMWEKWDSQKRPREDDETSRKQKHKKSKRKKKRRRLEADRKAEASEVSLTSGSEADSRTSLDAMLTRTAPRGRGNTGPRAEETGPFLFPTDEQERQEYEMERYTRKLAAGAECPEWIRRENADQSQAQTGRMPSASPSHNSAEKSKPEKIRKAKRKSKASKKEHKKKRRKEVDSPA